LSFATTACIVHQPIIIANCKTIAEAAVAATARAAWASRTESIPFVMCILLKMNRSDG
jgi:hypothetical protein